MFRVFVVLLVVVSVGFVASDTVDCTGVSPTSTQGCLCGACKDPYTPCSTTPFGFGNDRPYGGQCDGQWTKQNPDIFLCVYASTACGSGTRIPYRTEGDGVYYYQCATPNNRVPEAYFGRDEDNMANWFCKDDRVNFNTFETCDTDTENTCSQSCQIEPNTYCIYAPICDDTTIATTSSCYVLGDTYLPIVAVELHVEGVNSLAFSAVRSLVASGLATLANVNINSTYVDGMLEKEESILGIYDTPRACPSSGSLYSNRVVPIVLQAHIEVPLLEDSYRIASNLNLLSLSDFTSALRLATSLSGLSITFANASAIATRDTTPPTGNVSVAVSGNPYSSCVAGVGDIIRINLTTTEVVRNVRLNSFNIDTRSRISAISTQGSGMFWYFEYIVNSTDPSGALTFSVHLEDAIGNPTNIQHTEATCNSAYEIIQIDMRGPTISVEASDKVPSDDYPYSVDRLLNLLIIATDASALVFQNTSLISIELEGCDQWQTSVLTNVSRDIVTATFLIPVTSYTPVCTARVRVVSGTYQDGAGNWNDQFVSDYRLVEMNYLDSNVYWGVVGAAIAVAVPIVLSVLGYMFLASRNVHPIARTTNLFAILVLSLSLVVLAAVGIAGLQKRDISSSVRIFSCAALPHFVAHPAILIVTLILARNIKLKYWPDDEHVGVVAILAPTFVIGSINAILMGVWAGLYEGHSYLSRGTSVPWWQCTRGKWGLIWGDYILLTGLVIVGVVLVIRVSRDDPAYREIKQMSFVFYNIAILGCVALPVMFLIQNPAGWFIAVSSALIVDVLAVCSVFMFRLWKSIRQLVGEKSTGTVVSPINT